MEDVEEATRAARYGHPVIATLAGAAILILGALLLPRFAGQSPLGMLLGIGAGAALLLWGIGFAVTTRHAPLAWKLGSLAALAAAGLGGSLIAHGQYETIARADASSFAEVEFGPGGTAQLPAGAAARGPLSKLFAASVAADAQAQREFGAALGKLGAGALTSPYLLAQDPRALGQCDAIAGLTAMAKEQAAGRDQRGKALADTLAAAKLPASAKQGIADMARARQGGSAGEDPPLANQLAMADATAALCRLLAKRGWFNQGGYFGFRSTADAAAFRALAQRRMTLAGEAERFDRAARDRMTAGRELVRDALSKSIYAGG